MAQQCFTSWRDHTASCYTDIALNFTSKLQHALNLDPLTTFETMETCLATVSLNLGLIGQTHLKQIFPYNSTMDGPTHSTPIACCEFKQREYQQQSQDSLKVNFVSDLLLSGACPDPSETCPLDLMLYCSEGDTEPMTPLQLFTDDNSHFPKETISKTQENVDSGDGPSIHSCSNSHSQLCTCLEPDVVEHIHDLKQKLDSLSASLESFNENTLPSQPHTTVYSIELPDPVWPLLPSEETELSKEKDDDRSPILTPPPEFAANSDTDVSGSVHVQYSIITLSVYFPI